MISIRFPNGSTGNIDDLMDYITVQVMNGDDARLIITKESE